MPVDKEQEDAQTPGLISVVLLLILDLASEDVVMSKHGLSRLNSLIVTIEYSRNNANRLIVGNSMIIQVHINALTLTMKYNSADHSYILNILFILY